MSEGKLVCSFCGKNQNQVQKLIAGPQDVHICDECIELCGKVISNDPAVKKVGKKPAGSKEKEVPPIKDLVVPNPKDLRKYLDQYVIGQEDAKITLSVAVYNHYQRLKHPEINDVELDKTNMLLLGPTGSGKTLLAKSVARYLDVPFSIADATTLTESGYVGDDVESIISRLLQVANGNVELAQRGIIFIDEIDKKARRGDSASITRDVSGEGVQQALLKIIEGSVVRVPPEGGRKHPNAPMVEVDTSQILFIVGGAFVGLEKLVEKRLNSDKTLMGFGGKIRTKKDSAEVAELLKKVEPEDLVNFGLIPELIGRVPVITALAELDEGQLVQVLREPKNALVKQYKAMFGLENVAIDFTDESLKAIANIAKERGTGARGLRSVIEGKLTPLMYDIKEFRSRQLNKIIVTDIAIKGEADIQVVFDPNLPAAA